VDHDNVAFDMFTTGSSAASHFMPATQRTAPTVDVMSSSFHNPELPTAGGMRTARFADNKDATSPTEAQSIRQPHALASSKMPHRSAKSRTGVLVGRSGKSISAATMRKAFQSLGSDSTGDTIELENVVQAMEHKVPPNQLLQLLVVIKRAAVKRFRDFYPTTVIDTALLLSAACIVGAIHGTGWAHAKAASNAVMAMTTLATLTGATFLRTFVKVCLLGALFPAPHQHGLAPDPRLLALACATPAHR
jgi:hypothetical protein